jgi:starch synthase
VVRATGGLADSVQRYDPAAGRGTGVLFREFATPALTRGLQAALDLYAQIPHWTRMMQNGMAQDFSWEHQVQDYERLYATLGETPAA